jgi:hypothetical protein
VELEEAAEEEEVAEAEGEEGEIGAAAPALLEVAAGSNVQRHNDSSFSTLRTSARYSGC